MSFGEIWYNFALTTIPTLIPIAINPSGIITSRLKLVTFAE